MLFGHSHLRFYRRNIIPVVLLNGDVTYRLADAASFPWDRHPGHAHAAAYRKRFEEGGRALIGTVDGELVFTAWIARHRLRVDELAWTWRIAPADAVVYDVVTTEAWRGRGIYPEALRRLAGLLAEEGLRFLWIYAERTNAASIRGIEKAQFAYRGDIACLHLAGVALRRGRVERVNLSSLRRDGNSERGGST